MGIYTVSPLLLLSLLRHPDLVVCTSPQCISFIAHLPSLPPTIPSLQINTSFNDFCKNWDLIQSPTLSLIHLPWTSFAPPLHLPTHSNHFPFVQSTQTPSAFTQYTKTSCSALEPTLSDHTTHSKTSFLHPHTSTSCSYINLPRSLSLTLIKSSLNSNKITFTLN